MEGKAPLETELEKLDFLTEEEKKASEHDNQPIEHYWSKALKNQEVVGGEITTKDEAILNTLTSVTFTTHYHPSKEEETFKVIFTFAPNDYFTNTQLIKTVVVDTEE